jgi:hypothetical protein
MKAGMMGFGELADVRKGANGHVRGEQQLLLCVTCFEDLK